MIHRTCLFLTLLAVFVTSVPHAQPVRRMILDRIDVQPLPQAVALRVVFNFPILYRRHFPIGQGDSLDIVIDPKPSQDVPVDDLRRRESLRIPEGFEGLIDEIRYEGDHPGRPWLVVDFHRRQHYMIRPGRDKRSIEIVVEQADANGGVEPEGQN